MQIRATCRLSLTNIADDAPRCSPFLIYLTDWTSSRYGRAAHFSFYPAFYLIVFTIAVPSPVTISIACDYRDDGKVGLCNNVSCYFRRYRRNRRIAFLIISHLSRAIIGRVFEIDIRSSVKFEFVAYKARRFEPRPRANTGRFKSITQCFP